MVALDDVRELLGRYRDETGDCRCFDDYANELATLPGPYAPPSGEILVARDGRSTRGVVALRKRADGVAEVKRLYVSSDARGQGLGKSLALAAFDEARRMGYRRAWLETLETMEAAVSLYRALGMREVEPEAGHSHAFELDP